MTRNTARWGANMVRLSMLDAVVALPSLGVVAVPAPEQLSLSLSLLLFPLLPPTLWSPFEGWTGPALVCDAPLAFGNVLMPLEGR